METEKQHIIRRTWVNACRFFLAAAFLFSGFVKAIDPLGTCYKIEDYLAAFGMSGWFPEGLPLLVAIVLPMVEFCVGAFLLFGVRRRIGTTGALLLMAVMTPLTFYLALADPVSDCGCFGDAWVLTNWETFAKNLLLLVAAITVFRNYKLVRRFVTQELEWTVSMYTPLFICGISIYCLWNLPLLDFRPYRIGTDIRQAMEMPEGARPPLFETTFVMEKEGKQQEFTLENYPDSTWTFVKTHTVLKEKGYEPPIHDFSIQSLETGEDLTERILADSSYTFLMIVHRVELADDSHIDLINDLYDYCVERGYAFYALTSSTEQDIENWRDRTGAEYPFCLTDDITLKTIVRSNPGMLLLKKGVILNKWSDNRLPDEYILTDRLENLPLGQLQKVSDWQTMGAILLWFVVPLMLVVVADTWLQRRRTHKPKNS